MVNRLHIIMVGFGLIYNVFQCNSQVVINITYPDNNGTNFDKLWDISIYNPTSLTYQVYLLSDLRNKTGSIQISGRTSAIQINPGNTKITALTFNKNITYTSNSPENQSEKNNNQIIKAGDYNYCIKVFQFQEQIDLGENCIDFSISSDTAVQKGRDSTFLNNNYVRNFSGTTELFGNYANSKNDNPLIPENNLWFTGNPTLEILSLPVGAKFFITSDHHSNMQNADAISFYFDVVKFKENLKQKATTKIRENETVNNYTSRVTKNSLSDYKNVEKILSNPTVVSDLAKLEEVKKLEKQLSDTSLINNKGKYDSINEKYNEYSDIILKRKGYEKLIDKKSITEKLYKDSTQLDLNLAKKYNSDDLTLNRLKKSLTDSMTIQDSNKYDSIQKRIAKFEKSNKKLKEYNKLVNEYKDFDLNNAQSQLNDSLLHNDLGKYDSLSKKVKENNAKYEKIRDLEKLIDKNPDVESVLKDTNLIKISKTTHNYEKYKNYDLNKLNDPNELKGKLSELGLIKKYESILLPVQDLTIGLCTPNYSEFSLSNVPVKGINIELLYNKVYFAFTSGSLQQAILQGSFSENCYKQKVNSALLGYGEKMDRDDDFTSLCRNKLTTLCR